MYTINKPNKTTVEIKISTTPQEWQEAVSKVYERTKGKYAVQGFRKGHVPQKVVEKTSWARTSNSLGPQDRWFL